ncbi:MAG: MATE family efflux transporter [Coprobacillus sp.]
MKNMTIGNPTKLIFYFAMPLMLGNILQQLYTMVDTMIVGQFLGVDALASLGAADWINWMLLGIVMGFTQGFSIRISHSFGAQDFKKMEKTLGLSIILCAFIGIVLTVLAQVIIEPLLIALNTPSNIINGSITYLRVMSAGVLIVMFYNCCSCVLRALGNSRSPLIAMIFAALLNIVLDLLFVCVFHMGIAGAAIATLISQLSATLFCIYVLNKELPFTLTKESFRFTKESLSDLIRLGSPLAFQNAIISVGGIIVQSVINSFGFLFVAGFTATNKLYGLLEVAAISFGYAITTFNSQNYGAKQYDRMKKGVFQANLLSIGTSIVISLIMFIFGQQILMLFISGKPDEVKMVLDIAFKYLSVMALCLPILYVLHTYRSALQGMENTFIPMLSGIIELFMRVGIALLLPLYIGQDGIYFAEVFAWTGAAILLYLSYKIKIKNLMQRKVSEI